ncbi:hypothetical protein BpHYR1_045050 [Brachionus plicatilis]|uniref:Uncharacterized protein n=1 Tax=Brachionus plicatilis TaxID=10195 RepID=A0A3M7QK99_BRAPC|nr:hypothetical protein BpHYR1_045050 [Brachionus plicatilis]
MYKRTFYKKILWLSKKSNGLRGITSSSKNLKKNLKSRLRIMFFVYRNEFLNYSIENLSHSIYLFNLSIIEFISVFNSLKVSDSRLLCFHSSILGMAVYRFICIWKIILSIVLIWIVSIAFVLVPKFVSNIPVFYHFGLDTCIENYSNRLQSFWFFIKKSRSRVSNLSDIKSNILNKKINLTDKNLENASSIRTISLEKISGTNENLQIKNVKAFKRIMNRRYYFQLKLIDLTVSFLNGKKQRLLDGNKQWKIIKEIQFKYRFLTN